MEDFPGDELEPVLPLVVWRVRQLEIIEAAIRLEVSELREKGHHYVTRQELAERAAVRREWPIILAVLLNVTVAVITLVVTLSGAH